MFSRHFRRWALALKFEYSGKTNVVRIPTINNPVTTSNKVKPETSREVVSRKWMSLIRNQVLDWLGVWSLQFAKLYLPLA